MFMMEGMQAIRCQKKEFFFYSSYFLLIVYMILKSTVFGFHDHGATYIVIMVLLIFRILMMRVPMRSVSLMFVLCLLAALCLFHTWDPIVPVVFMMLLASADINYRSIVQLSFSVMAILVMIILIFTAFGMIDDITTVRYLGGYRMICHSAGFNHNSKLPTYYCFLFFEYVYLKHKKVSLFEVVLWMAGGFGIFLFCVERLRFYNLILAAIFILILGLIKGKHRQIKKIISIAIYPFLCLIAICLGYFYDPSNGIMRTINIALSNRLYLEHIAFNHYPITLFGQILEMGEDAISINGYLEYFYIDSGYVYLLVIYGLVIGFVIMAVYIAGIYQSFKMSDTKLWIWFICIAVDSIVGNQMLSIWINPLLFVPFCKYCDEALELKVFY